MSDVVYETSLAFFTHILYILLKLKVIKEWNFMIIRYPRQVKEGDYVGITAIPT